MRFRQAHEQLRLHDSAGAVKRYLQLLKLAAEGSEAEVSEAIGVCLREEKPPLPDRVERVLARRLRSAMRPVHLMEPFEPDLTRYDELIGQAVPR